MIIDAYKKSPDWILKLISENARGLSIEEINRDPNVNVRVRSYYSETEKKIFIDSNKDSQEYLLTFRHELGHFIDDSLGRISMTENFIYSIDADKGQYERGMEYGMDNFQRLIHEMSENNEILSNRYLSDILSAVFINDTSIREVYYKSFLPFYKHDTEYWAEIEGPRGAVQKEVFADMFAIYSENNRNIIEFVERNFPNMALRFKKEMVGNG